VRLEVVGRGGKDPQSLAGVNRLDGMDIAVSCSMAYLHKHNEFCVLHDEIDLAARAVIVPCHGFQAVGLQVKPRDLLRLLSEFAAAAQ